MIAVEKEIDVAARTAWAEARGDGEIGMHAALCVITNRVQLARLYFALNKRPHPLFGDGTYTQACKRAKQFSCWNSNDPNLAKLLSVDESDPSFNLAVHLATKAVHGELWDLTFGSTHYFAHKVVSPVWAKGVKPRAIIKNHTFLKL